MVRSPLLGLVQLDGPASSGAAVTLIAGMIAAAAMLAPAIRTLRREARTGGWKFLASDAFAESDIPPSPLCLPKRAFPFPCKKRTDCPDRRQRFGILGKRS